MSHWRKDQGRDPYFQKAKQEGYRARSAYKLIQINDKFHIIHRRDTVVDLGAAPGSWSQVLAKLVGPDGRIIALDLQEMQPIEGVTIFQGDMLEPDVQERIKELAHGRCNVVLSDAAPSTTGIKLRDHVISIELARAAFIVAQQILIPGGNMVLKVFQGEDLPSLIHDVKMCFHPVKIHTPPATRNESWEAFIVAQKFKGH
jgi:23S rRNA (uridine2552-2'-O)-methyltransferase